MTNQNPFTKPVRIQEPLQESDDWRSRAACINEDPELFFPVGNTGPAIQQIELAKKICRRCAVIDSCLAYALDSGQDHGVWGGLSEEELIAARRRRSRAAQNVRRTHLSTTAISEK